MLKKRIFAWVLLILFVLITVNILFIGYHRTESGLLYILAALIFLFGKKNLVSYEDIEDGEEK